MVHTFLFFIFSSPDLKTFLVLYPNKTVSFLTLSLNIRFIKGLFRGGGKRIHNRSQFIRSLCHSQYNGTEGGLPDCLLFAGRLPGWIHPLQAQKVSLKSKWITFSTTLTWSLESFCNTYSSWSLSIPKNLLLHLWYFTDTLIQSVLQFASFLYNSVLRVLLSKSSQKVLEQGNSYTTIIYGAIVII